MYVGIKNVMLRMQQKSYVIFDVYRGRSWFNCYKDFSCPVQVYEADAYRIKAGWRRTKVVVKVSSFK